MNRAKSLIVIAALVVVAVATANHQSAADWVEPYEAGTGSSWTDPVPLNNIAGTDSGNDANVQLASDGNGHWVAVWSSGDDLGGTIGDDFDILVARSTDNGASWTDPEPLNNNADIDSQADLVPEVTTDRTGNWVVVWYSKENVGGAIGTDFDILVARSTDNGANWTDPAPLNTNAETDSGVDSLPRVTTDGGENWVAAWASRETLDETIGTDWDILVVRSTNPVPCTCGDIDGSGGPVSLNDFATFALCFELSSAYPPECDERALNCSDLDGNGTVELADFATFALWFGLESSSRPPDCD